MHKNYCNYPNDPCCCGYREKQKNHAKWCAYPKDYCSCDIGFSRYDIDSGKKYERHDKDRFAENIAFFCQKLVKKGQGRRKNETS